MLAEGGVLCIMLFDKVSVNSPKKWLFVIYILSLSLSLSLS